ncbi:MAG: hypothetical protein IT160_14190, partial [Bryobacterales bacterium]|nr:hypothetical protein [Bryobacterales bacterium]
MKRFALPFLLALTLGSTLCLRAEDLSEGEQDQLRQAVAEAGSSPIEFLRALENHLARFPNSPKKPELERALLRVAIEVKDTRRIIRYGERVLARDGSDATALEHVTQALLSDSGRQNNEKALRYARNYEQVLLKLRETPETGDPREQAKRAEELDRGQASALVFQARATGNLGNSEAALALAQKSFQTFATAEGARESARWALAAGRTADAVRYWADAFTIAEPRATDADRLKDRQDMGEAWKRDHGTAKGLGDVVLEAYDRNRALIDARRQKLRQLDPNAGVTDPMKYTLTA